MPEYKNPNQTGAPGGGGSSNNNFLTTMLLMVVVFGALQFFRSRHDPQTAPPNNPPAAASAPAAPAGAVPPPSLATPAVSSGNTAAVQASSESSTVIENELFRVTFSNRGGDVTSWILKRFKDSSGQPLDLVHTEAARRFGFPLSLYSYDPSLTNTLNSALYVPSAVGTIAAPGQVSFEFSSGDLHVSKTFRFDETYVLHASVAVTRNGAPVRALLSWPGGFGDQENLQAYAGAQVDLSSDGHEKHLAPKNVSGGDTRSQQFDWAGVSDLYFAAIFLPDRPASSTLALLHNELEVPKDSRKNGVGHGVPARDAKKGADVKVPILGAAFGDTSGSTETRLFVGPKAVQVLKNIHSTGSDVTLAPLLDFGFFGPIGKYLFLALQFIHAHIASNWGWSIILLTIVINLILLPLRIKTMQSGLKMQRIQPQMDAIKARYKGLKATDPKRNEMNSEIMQLQKDNGVNMFGGCIPTLIQLPLLFAFFSMLPKVVELRHAHWYWLPDLSAADPYHILPILMVVSQFLVQFYTPSPGVDPEQQRMMAFMMPAVSGYMTWNYASGLALYWSIGNLIGILQQAIMNQTSLGREMREIAARRARNKAGKPGAQPPRNSSKASSPASSKTIQGRR